MCVMSKSLVQLVVVFLVGSGAFAPQHVSAAPAVEPANVPLKADIVVYGATPAGVITAVAAGRAGRSVLLVEPQVRVGGMVSGGLCKTDIGKRETVGGIS